MLVPRARGCLYLIYTRAIVSSHVYTADHEQAWQPYPVHLYSAICDDHTCIDTVVICLHTPLRRYLVNITDINTYLLCPISLGRYGREIVRV